MSTPHSAAFVSSSAKKLTICFIKLLSVFSFIVITQDKALCLNVTIIESQSFNAGHDMDVEWLNLLQGMGHTPTIVPQSTLDNNTFFSTTDILIVASGVIILPANRINTIIQFVQSGKPVYLQSEYLSTLGGNIAFESIITTLGGTFTWGANFSGDLQPMNVLGSFATTNNIVPSIGYFWYSVAGYGDCNLINMLEYGGAYHGFQYVPTNSSFGSIITTTDQDWIRATTSPQLMQNIITHLITPGQTSNGPPISLGNDTTLCPGSILTLDATATNATYVWQDSSIGATFNVTQSGIYWVEVTANGCISTDTIIVDFSTIPIISLGNDSTLCEGQSVLLDATTANATYLWQDNSVNSTFSVTQSGTYSVQVTTLCGVSTDTIQLNFTPLPVFSLGIDSILCQGETLTLDPGIANATYLWQDGTTGSTYAVNQAGVYSVSVTVNGCSSVDSIQIDFNPLPVFSLGNDLILCQGQTVTLDATIPNGTYQWQDNSTGANFIVSQQGVYWVVVTVNNCSSSDTVNVNFNPLPVVNLGTDLTLCQGESVTLDATVNNGTYIWQDNTTNQTYTVTQPGTYWVTVTVNGCSSTDSVQVDFNPLPVVNLGSDLTLCDGESVILDATTLNGTYVWQDNSTSATLTVSEQGNYTVAVTVNGCIGTDTVSVFINPLPLVNLGNDTLACNGDELMLDATLSGATYVWQDNSSAAVYNVNESGTYAVTVTVNNCSSSDEITFQFENCNVNLEMPNVFTPNQDGLNDQFIPILMEGITSANLKIFDRWGKELFDTNNLVEGWNGKYNGEVCTDGTFLWIVVYSTIKGKNLSQKGTVLLHK